MNKRVPPKFSMKAMAILMLCEGAEKPTAYGVMRFRIRTIHRTCRKEKN